MQCMQELISNGISEANAAIACSQQQGSVAWGDAECLDRLMYREFRGRLSSDVGVISTNPIKLVIMHRAGMSR